MNWKRLDISDKPFFDEFLRRHETTLSDYPFTNLYMWDEERKYEWCISETFLCIRFGGVEPCFLYPIGKGNPAKVIHALAKESAPFKMRAIPEEALPFLKDLPYAITSENDRFDYIYDYQELMELPGNRFQAKRNLIHQFERVYDFTYKAIDEEVLPQVIAMEKTLPPLHDQIPTLRALDHFFELNLSGGAILVDNQVIAFSFAEKITQEMLLVHAEKALSEYKGAYQMINRELLLHLPPCKWVNREESLGLSTLAQAKDSYHPSYLLKKFLLN